jgi:hypothetical protein
MAITRRTLRIAKLKTEASDPAIPADEKLLLLKKLSRLRPGEPLRRWIRHQLRLILVEHPEYNPDCRDVMDRLTEVRLQKARIKILKEQKPTPPFPVPREFAGRFTWRYRFSKNGMEVEWALNEI